MRRFLCFSLVFASLNVAFPADGLSAQPDYWPPASSEERQAGRRDMETSRMVKAVLLCRHGVRTPVQSPDELALWSSRKWPVWKKAPGQLTERGAALLRAAGMELRQDLSETGLLPATGCPKEGAVVAYADNMPRTFDSAGALIDGLATGCGIQVFSSEKDRPDPIFHPVQDGLVPEPLLSQSQQDALLNKLKKIRQKQASRIEELAALLGPAPRSSFSAVDEPTFLFLPENAEKKRIKLTGGLSIAASAAEILMLESFEWPVQSQNIAVAQKNEGFERIERSIAPKDQKEKRAALQLKTLQIIHAPFHATQKSVPVPPPAEWLEVPLPQEALEGKTPLLVNPRTALSLLSVHSDVKNALDREPEVARTSGLPLLSLIASTLASESSIEAMDRASLVFLFGHDTNIAHVAALLDLHWQNGSFPPDSIPPGAMLLFGLWDTPQGKIVQTSFLSQSLTAFLSTDEHVMSEAALDHCALALPEASLSGAWTPAGPGLPLKSFLDHVQKLHTSQKNASK